MDVRKTISDLDEATKELSEHANDESYCGHEVQASELLRDISVLQAASVIIEKHKGKLSQVWRGKSI